MGTARKLVAISVDDFIAWEDQQPERHELVGGEVYAMVGGVVRHGRVARNLMLALGPQLKRPCEPFASDMKVRAEEAGSVYYPDLVITCREQHPRSTVIHDPKVVVEVLSPSTARSDRQRKRPDYATIPSMRVIILVDPEERVVELDRRDPDGGWSRETFTGEGTLDLPEVGASLTLDEIFAE
ncbi:Uma2 family endonuclease [Aerophototrophica crusticola]|uniref:Uma2 family endonuclease n=1 Tax=Aerophototrophica crusticola TaxID=1709002 RepID=A0A858R9J3_9PROT|nr:Uma2 family endonuclease [Rhodospirillaceae bacterium B3]